MQFSEKWLREWVNPECTTQELVERLTMAGLEVDAVSPVAGEFSGVVVGQIIDRQPHPDADKLSICTVDVNDTQPLTIVCGAPNARAGIKIPCAKVGAVLPGNFKIKKAKLRGQESFGMLCSEAELGLADEADGLMELAEQAPVGTCVRQYLELDDQIIEVDLTPNRGDCLSIAGLAREVGVLFSQEVNVPEISELEVSSDKTFAVELLASDRCPNYVGRVVEGVNVEAQTPLWIVEKLRRSGIRSIDPVVDITNYVMLELGQPMHAFDLDTLAGKIQVRLANENEKLTLLDGQELSLSPEHLVIADQTRALALAGIMGGENSGVSGATKNIFLESAYFDPVAIAGHARSFGLHTDSSHRFERGVDYQLQARAVERASELLLQISGGRLGPLVYACDEQKLPQAKTTQLRQSKVDQYLGFPMAATQIEEILQRLGMKFDKNDPGHWQVQAPSYRFDIATEVDLIEELGRIYGYENLPTRLPTMDMRPLKMPEGKLNQNRIAACLVDLDYQEAITYSFVEPEIQRLIDPQQQPLPLANPISADLAVMRTNLWCGLLKAVSYNQNRQQQRIRLFEIGHRFCQTGQGLEEDNRLAGAVWGPRNDEAWANDKQPVDFYDVKGDLEIILGLSGGGEEYEFQPCEHPALHPGQSCQIVKNEAVIGHFGALHPEIQNQLSLHGPIFLFELQLSSIENGRVPVFEEVSKFPEVRRDIALIVDQAVTAQQILTAIKQQGGDILRNVTLFDVYSGAGIEKGKKSIAMGLTLQHPSSTLNDNEINSLIDSMITFLKQGFNATLRE